MGKVNRRFSDQEHPMNTDRCVGVRLVGRRMMMLRTVARHDGSLPSWRRTRPNLIPRLLLPQSVARTKSGAVATQPALEFRPLRRAAPSRDESIAARGRT